LRHRGKILPSWPLLRLLPAPLAQLPDDVRAGLGRARDQGLIRYALDEVTGAAVVTRAGGR
jgi:hypothetical protein